MARGDSEGRVGKFDFARRCFRDRRALQRKTSGMQYEQSRTRYLDREVLTCQATSRPSNLLGESELSSPLRPFLPLLPAFEVSRSWHCLPGSISVKVIRIGLWLLPPRRNRSQEERSGFEERCARRASYTVARSFEKSSDSR